MRAWASLRQTIGGWVCLLLFPLVVSGSVVNIDFNGDRNTPGPNARPVTYQGTGAAGGGVYWNGLAADSRLPNGNDNDNLTVGGTNLLDTSGARTALSFVVSPAGGDSTALRTGQDTQNPQLSAALFSDYVFNNSAGNAAGESPFEIRGFGHATSVDLYFYRSSGGVTITGQNPATFAGSGLFTSANTIYFRNVPVSGGVVRGSFGSGTAVINGMTIVCDCAVVATPISILAQPSNVTALEGAAVAFQIQVANLDPVTYQWQRNTLSLPGATNGTCALSRVSFTNNGDQYRCILNNTLGSVLSSNATLTVIPDTTPPTIQRVQNLGSNSVRVVFSEPVDPGTATNRANYGLTDGVAILSAALGADPQTVLLQTTELTYGVAYTLMISNVLDSAWVPNSIRPDSSFIFTASEYLSANIGGTDLAGSLIGESSGFVLSATNGDMGGTADQFFFAYRLYEGDFDVQIRIESFAATDLWAKAGLMVREDLGTNSRFAATLATPTLAGSFFLSRAVAGDTAVATGCSPINYPFTWLRLERVGNVFNGYAGAEEGHWTKLGTATLSLPRALYFGMAGASHSPTQPAMVSFRELTNALHLPVTSVMTPREPLGPCSRRTGLVISEIMYHPSPRPDGKDLEFVELFNSQSFFQDVSGFRLSGDIDFTFPSGSVLPAGAFMVVAKNPADLQSAYALSSVLGPYAHRLPSASGTVRLRDRQDAVLLEIQYGSRFPWPRAADGAGHSLVLAKPSFGENDPQAWGASDQIGGSPGRSDGVGPEPLRAVLINEILVRRQGAAEDFIELYNHGNQAVDLSESFLTDDPATVKFVIPSGTLLPGRGFLAFGSSQLGFSLGVSDTIYLLNPGWTRVIDAVEIKEQTPDRSAGRSPDGAPTFRELVAPTPGGTNRPPFVHVVVINEIMAHPMSENNDDEYVELYNQDSNAVDLNEWKLDGAVGYEFPTNTIISGGGYLVIGRNLTNLLAKYPNLKASNAFGNYAGSLSDRGGALRLLRPDWEAMAPGGPAGATNLPYLLVDEVIYGAGGRWGKWADGGGSSLELLDPRADHRLAANWGDSDEASKTTNWTTIEYTGRLDLGNTSYPADSLHILLLGEGECLVDNVEVQALGGANLVPNSTFETGTNGWIFQGNHDLSTLETNAGYQSRSSLHLRASGDGDPGANRIRTRLNSTLAAATTATLRARVRWLHGHPELLLRLHGNWLEATGRMAIPTNLGTPGAPNSRAVANAGPAIYEVVHTPVLPAAQEPMLVTARVHDPDGVASVQLRWRLDPGSTLATVAMVDDGTGGDAVAHDGVYSALIPGQNSNGLVAFQVVAADGASPSAVATFPNDAPARECLVRFGETQPAGSFGTYRVWMTQAVLNRWSAREQLSNEPLDVTFVYGNQRVIYNAGGLYTGSPYKTRSYGSPVGAWCDYVLRFPPDDRFLGATECKLCYPGNLNDDATVQREQTAYWLAEQLGIPHNQRRYVNLFVNGVRRGVIMEDTQVPNSDVIAEHYPNDTDGELFKGALWFEYTDADLATFVPTPATLQKFTTTGGLKKLSRYRWNWQKRTVNGSVNDFSSLFSLVDALNSTTTVYTSQVEALVDLEQWVRTFAAEHIVGNWDSFGYRNGSNMYAYKPRSNRWQLLIWDVDVSLRSDYGTGPTSDLFEAGDPTMDRLLKNPPFRRAYWQALLDAANGPLLNSQVDPLLDAKYTALGENGLAVQSPEVIKTWISARRDYILGQLATVAADFTASGPATTTTNHVTLTGVAPIPVSLITVNGRTLDPSWSTLTNWSAAFLVVGGTNRLAVSACDSTGRVLATTNLTIAFTGTNAWPRVRINEWMADNTGFIRDPADNGRDDWFELYNPTAAAADLAGWTLTDSVAAPTQFVVPAGYVVPAAGFLLVWADGQPGQNSTNRPDLHVNFKLEKNGEVIELFAPDGTLMDFVAFGLQSSDLSEGRYPDGAEGIRRLTWPTPGAANVLTEFAHLTREGTTVTLTFTATPGLRYQAEMSDDLSGWTLLGTPQPAVGTSLTILDPNAGPGHRFYRVRIVP